MDNRGLIHTEQHVDPPPDENEEESEFEDEYDYEEAEAEEEEADDEEAEDEDEEEVEDEVEGVKREQESKLGEGWNREEMEGLVCPICFEAWSNGGEHYPSCLPCGHLYGMSCIRKWFGLGRSCNKCPQCNTKCMMKDVRRIYGSRVIVHDDAELQKRVQSLEAKCNSLKRKDAEWRGKEAEWLRREAFLHMHYKKKAKKEGELSVAQGSEELPSVDVLEQFQEDMFERVDALEQFQKDMFERIDAFERRLVERMDALEQRFVERMDTLEHSQQQHEQGFLGVPTQPPQ